jgi:hypothetical protein
MYYKWKRYGERDIHGIPWDEFLGGIYNIVFQEGEHGNKHFE